MRQIIVLDSAPLSMATNPRASTANEAAKEWIFELLGQNAIVVVPEIADYEVRRELLRSGKTTGIKNLDIFKSTLKFLPLDSPTMLAAAQLWATARQMGKPATDNLALDGDMILIAQAQAATRVWATQAAGSAAIIATTNTRHLTPFFDARLWHEIN